MVTLDQCFWVCMFSFCRNSEILLLYRAFQSIISDCKHVGVASFLPGGAKTRASSPGNETPGALSFPQRIKDGVNKQQ